MKISYDREVDALYIRFKETTVTTKHIEDGIALDYDAADCLAGIEILDARKRLDDPEAFKRVAADATMNDENVIPGQSTPLSFSTMQRQVLDALRSVETEEYRLGDWYLGALYALENPYNPDRTSQAAQSLRELLEKLPRLVRESISMPNFKDMRQGIFKRLVNDKVRYGEVWKDKVIDAQLDKTLRKIYRYMELNQQPTRKEQIQFAIRNIDPMADQMGFDIQKRQRDELHALWNQLEGFAHHGSSSQTDEHKFREYVSTLEQIVYDLLAPVTAQDQQEIQSILIRTEHSDADAESLYKLITRRGANYVYFFRYATDPVWIPFLKEKGFFRNPPETEYSSDGYVHFPSWPELQYLKKVCKDAPEEVIQLVLQLPAVNNPRVYDSILDIALELDGEQSVRLKPKMLEYARLEHQFLSFQYPKLLAHWTGEDQTEAALELANILVQFDPDPQAEEKQKQRKETHGDQVASMRTILRPVPRFNENYQEILNEGVRPLAEKVPYKVARMLMDATASMIRLGKHEDDLESGKSSDYSETWCPRLNKQSRDYRDPQETLVNTLTYACEKVYEKLPASIEALDSALRNQRWDVFKRLRQHLYALHPGEQTRPWIRELTLAHGDYGKWEHHYEFQQMIRVACEHFGAELLTEDERTQIFDAVLSGPSKEDFREWMGEQFTEDGFEQRKRYFHRQQLRPFAPVLFGEYVGYFQELENDEAADDITDESYRPVSESEEGGIVISRSPKLPDELSKLSDEELLDYINEWQDEHWKDDWCTQITIEALAGAFQTVFKDSIIPNASRHSFWIKNRDNILRPIYVRAMTNAMQEHVKAKNFDKLDEWLPFCEWVLSHPDPEHEEGVGSGRFGDESRESPMWHTSRRAVCDFIEACLPAAQYAAQAGLKLDVPLSFRGQLGRLLDMLCTQYDWHLDQDNLTLLNRDDQLTEAINTTRGRALENLVNFGFWVCRHDDKAEVSEIEAILEKRFGSEAEYPLTLPEFAILGKLYGSIFGLDEAWAIAQKSAFFPQNNLTAWLEAFGNFLRFNRPYKPIFDEVRNDFEFALKHLDCLTQQKHSGRKPRDILGQHLFTYYLWEVYPLKGAGSLLEDFYKATGGERAHWATLFGYVGRSLRNTGKRLDSGLKNRIIAFFEWRLKVGEPSELQEFIFWLEAECLEAEWRLNAYSRILDLRGDPDVDQWKDQTARIPSHAMRSLREMLPVHTPRAVECLAKLIDSMPRSGRFYIRANDAKAILKAGREHDDENVRKNARQARENLLRRGYFSVRD